MGIYLFFKNRKQKSKMSFTLNENSNTVMIIDDSSEEEDDPQLDLPPVNNDIIEVSADASSFQSLLQQARMNKKRKMEQISQENASQQETISNTNNIQEDIKEDDTNRQNIKKKKLDLTPVQENIVYTLDLIEADEKKNQRSVLNMVRCPICKTEVMVNPFQISICQHVFCKSCLDKSKFSQAKKTMRQCPLCCRTFDFGKNVSSSLAVKQLTDDVVVHCLKPECKWIGKFQMLNKHFKQLGEKEDETNSAEMKRKCKYIYKCDCNQYIDIRSRNFHEQSCQEISIECACGQKIKKKNFQNHINEDCENENTSCECQQYGCEWTGTREQLSYHMDVTCDFRLINKDFKVLKAKYNTLLKNNTNQVFEQSDIFMFTGLNKHSFKRQHIIPFVETIDQLENVTATFGSLSENSELAIEAIKTDGIFQSNVLTKEASKCKIEFIDKHKVIVITLASMQDRFFIFPDQISPIYIENIKGRIKFSSPVDTEFTGFQPFIVLYAQRRFLFADEEKNPYPYTLQPISAFRITQFSIKIAKNENKTSTLLLEKLQTFIDACQKYYIEKENNKNKK